MLERALNTGLCTWQGLVRNIEYLGMDDSIKRVMGKWWRRWVKTDVGRRGSEPAADASSITVKSKCKLNRDHKGERSDAKAVVEGLDSDEDVDDEDDEGDEGDDDHEGEYEQARETQSRRDRRAGSEGELQLNREHAGGEGVWRRETRPTEGVRHRDGHRERERRERRYRRSGHGADGDVDGDANGDGDGEEVTEMDTDMELGDSPGPLNRHAVTEERLRSLMGAL